MPAREAPCVELGSAPEIRSTGASPSPSESSTITSTSSSVEPHNVQAPPLFRVLAMPPPDPEQPPGQDELERRLPGYRRIIIPRELTLIELLKQYSGVTSDDEVLRIREAKLRVVAERVGLRRLHVLAPRLQSLTLDGSAIASLRDLGIGLVRLKFLSINRCNLTSLDGIWGLAALRELHACGNKIQDLQPLAVLQKLHTLNLSNNPISESSRFWTLGVCGSLRKLTLLGTPVSEAVDYRSRIASALPMLVYLDERTLHNDDTEFDTEIFDVTSSSGSDCEAEGAGDQLCVEPEPGPSTLTDIPELPPDQGPEEDSQTRETSRGLKRRRPATTEGGGLRPNRPSLPMRPHTASGARRLEPLTRLEIMNTLLDEEWRSSGSSLTSHSPVCGNLAQALRRPTTSRQPRSLDIPQIHKELAAATLEEAARTVAAEIPRAPRMEDWAKFKEDTGIEIEIDFNKRPEGCNPTAAIDRLEQIEQETKERFERESHQKNVDDAVSNGSNDVVKSTYAYSSVFELDNPLDNVLSELDNPLDNVLSELDNPLDNVLSELDNPLDNVLSELDNPLDNVLSELDNPLDNVLSELDNPLDNVLSELDNPLDNVLSELDNPLDNVLSDFGMWRGIQDLAPASDPLGDVDAIFNDTNAIQSRQRRGGLGRDITNY